MNTIIESLEKGSVEIEGQLVFGSNYIFLVKIEFRESNFFAVYKPQKGEIPLWDFPPKTLANRETAAYVLSEALGWKLVPPTVIRSNAPLGKGSLQYFIAHDPQLNYFTFPPKIKDQLRPTAVFDILINNADRKGSHILIDEKESIKLIDHGICFHESQKLRTVVWDFIGERIPISLMDDINQLGDSLRNRSKIAVELEKLLSKQEIDALIDRIEKINESPFFPEPSTESRPFPFPLV